MVSTRLQDEIASIRGNTTLFNCENTQNRPILDYPSLNDNLQHNTPKWYHKNVIYELATIKNSFDTVEQDISIWGFEMTWWRYGPFVRGVEKDLHILRTDYVDHVPTRSML